ncbi:MAG TPA: hypothetical protein VM889_08520 [Candidatus Thermoplasmatota archaeon]|nr:hypothetical protein [Candidatus Thermoplasmatota archaeon]
MRPPARFLLLIVAFTLLASPALAKIHEVRVKYEMEEQGGPAPGQKNCVREAALGEGTADCPEVVDTRYHPQRAILMLDSVYTVVPGVEGYLATLRDPAPNSGTPSNGQGTSLHRHTDGLLPEIIYPGFGQFEGWLGRWHDQNADAFIQYHRGATSSPSAHPPANEWMPALGGTMLGFIEPGSHPSYGARTRPMPTEPDIVYASTMVGTYGAWAHATGATSDGIILFVDGSLFKSARVDTVTNAILAPDPDGRFPFTLGATSLLDIDRYAAVAPGPIAALYGVTVGDLVTDLGSPSMGWCPNGCRVGPVPMGALPVAEPLGPAHAALYAPYPREWRDTERGVGAAYGSAYLAAYEPWADLRPYWSPLHVVNENASSLRPGPLPGRGEHGGQAMVPGILTFELRTGLWHDADGDGVVGSALAGDVYESGSRPDPDDYVNSQGEYLGQFVTKTPSPSSPLHRLAVTLRPHDTWGPAGIFVGAPPSLTTIYNEPTLACAGGNCVREPTNYWKSGREEVTLYAYRDSQELGRYVVGGVIFPTGTLAGGFEACTDVVYLRHASGGAERIDPVWDCDAIERLA